MWRNPENDLFSGRGVKQASSVWQELAVSAMSPDVEDGQWRTGRKGAHKPRAGPNPLRLKRRLRPVRDRTRCDDSVTRSRSVRAGVADRVFLPWRAQRAHTDTRTQLCCAR